MAGGLLFLYNLSMEELIERLREIGFAEDVCNRIKDRYDGDLEELRRYVMFCVALFDDRHEYAG